MGFPGNGEGSNVEVCSIVEVYMGVPQVYMVDAGRLPVAKVLSIPSPQYW